MPSKKTAMDLDTTQEMSPVDAKKLDAEAVLAEAAKGLAEAAKDLPKEVEIKMAPEPELRSAAATKPIEHHAIDGDDTNDDCRVCKGVGARLINTDEGVRRFECAACEGKGALPNWLHHAIRAYRDWGAGKVVTADEYGTAKGEVLNIKIGY